MLTRTSFRWMFGGAAVLLALWVTAGLAARALDVGRGSHRADEVDFAPAQGPVASKVYVIAYSDFVCPVCARAAPYMQKIREEWPNDVRFEFHQTAPSVHHNADNASIASLAAQRQGKFWEMHDLLFANRPAFEVEKLRSYAQQLGLDMERWDRDFADPALRRRVEKESSEMKALGSSGTPSFVINGRLLIGWGSWYGFREQIEQELKAMNMLLAEGVPLAEAHERRARELLKDEAGFALWKEIVLDRLARSTGG